MDTDGRVAFRALWAGDEHALRQVLDSVSTGRAAAKPQSRAMLKPMARGIGYFHEVLKAAGPVIESWLEQEEETRRLTRDGRRA